MVSLAKTRLEQASPSQRAICHRRAR